jgi:hypothetical protein
MVCRVDRLTSPERLTRGRGTQAKGTAWRERLIADLIPKIRGTEGGRASSPPPVRGKDLT